jgi:HlyD family secretion protein
MAEHNKRLLLTTPLRRWRIILAASLTLATGIVIYSFSQNRFSQQVIKPAENLPPATATAPPARVAVTA